MTKINSSSFRAYKQKTLRRELFDERRFRTDNLKTQELIVNICGQLMDKEQALLELKFLSFQDQVFYAYKDKYPSTISWSEMEDNVKKIIGRFRPFLDRSSVDFVRDFLIREIGRGFFVSKSTHIFNLKMQKNIGLLLENPKLFRVSGNKLLQLVLLLFSKKIDSGLCKSLEMVEGEKTISLEQQLMARYHRNFFFNLNEKIFREKLQKFIDEQIFIFDQFLIHKPKISLQERQEFFSKLDDLLFGGDVYVYRKDPKRFVADDDGVKMYKFIFLKKESFDKYKLIQDNKRARKVINYMAYCFTNQELKAMEFNSISFKHQLFREYGDKYLFSESFDDIKKHINGVIRCFRTLFDISHIDFLREFVIKELGRGIFITKHTHIFNSKMNRNIDLLINSKKRSFRLLNNYLLQIMVVLISRKMGTKFLNLLAMEEQNKKISFKKQLLSRYHKNFLNNYGWDLHKRISRMIREQSFLFHKSLNLQKITFQDKQHLFSRLDEVLFDFEEEIEVSRVPSLVRFFCIVLMWIFDWRISSKYS